MMDIKNIVIAGGGFAGWYTAAVIRNKFPDIKLTVIDSDKHPRLGVGETLGWSSPYDWKNLLGLNDDRLLMWETGAIYKYGVTANNFYQDNSSYSYGKFFNLKVNSLTKFYGSFEPSEFNEHWSQRAGEIGLLEAWFAINRNNDKDFNDYIAELSETTHFAKNPWAPYDQDNRYILRPSEGWSYHIDAEQTVNLFKQIATTDNPNCTHISSAIIDVALSADDTIEKITLENGAVITSDLFIDATGFARVLVGKLQNNKWRDMGSEFCNTACVCPTRYIDPGAEMRGGTEFFGEDHGWRFKINLYHRIGNGYIFNDNAVDPQKIMDHMVNLTDGRRLADPRFIRWTPGYYTQSWMGNVIPIGVGGHLIDPFDGPSFDIHSRALEDLVVSMTKDDADEARAYFNQSQNIVKHERNMRLIMVFGVGTRSGEWWQSRRDLYNKQSYAQDLIDVMSDKKKDIDSRLKHFWQQMYYRMYLASKMDRTKLAPIPISNEDAKMADSFFSYNRSRNDYIATQEWPNYYEWLKENRFNGLSSARILEKLNPTLANNI